MALILVLLGWSQCGHFPPSQLLLSWSKPLTFYPWNDCSSLSSGLAISHLVHYSLPSNTAVRSALYKLVMLCLSFAPNLPVTSHLIQNKKPKSLQWPIKFYMIGVTLFLISSLLLSPFPHSLSSQTNLLHAPWTKSQADSVLSLS